MKIWPIVAVIATCFASILAFGDNIDNSGIKIDSRDVKCLVCRATVNEIIKDVDKIDPRKRVEVSGFRIGADGNTISKSVQLAKSETYLTELFESVCNTMDDYIKARYKKSKRLTILSLTGGGFMNPEMSKVDFVQDGDLNKSLKHYCLEILEDNDEAFLAEFMREQRAETILHDLCTEKSKYCDEGSELLEPEPEYLPEPGEPEPEEELSIDDEASDVVPSDATSEEASVVADTTSDDTVLSSIDKQPDDEHLCKADAGQCDAGAPQPEFVAKTNENEVETDTLIEEEQRDEL